MQGAGFTFHDGYWYCYANCTAMLLSAAGEHVDPRLVEVLTGVGLGAFVAPENELPFFSGLAGPPDVGIGRALGLLGFAFDTGAAGESAAAAERGLAALLDAGPAILGPLDMSLLSYNPGRPRRPGVDHYVIADRLEAGRVVVYDPAGFAGAVLPTAELAAAWRADAIGYKAVPYQYWARPRRIGSPASAEIAGAAVEQFKRLYRDADHLAATTGCAAGPAAVERVAEWLRADTVTPAQRAHLLHFALPLGAKRALDFAAFLAPRCARLAALKRQQAALFGQAFSRLARDEARAAAGAVSGIAEAEREIRTAIERL